MQIGQTETYNTDSMEKNEHAGKKPMSVLKFVLYSTLEHTARDI